MISDKARDIDLQRVIRKDRTKGRQLNDRKNVHTDVSIGENPTVCQQHHCAHREAESVSGT